MWRDLQHLQPHTSTLIAALLNPRFPAGRSLDILMRLSAMDERECRMALVEAGARLVVLNGGREGWTLREVGEDA